jgi:hypothetical protein
MVLINDFKNAEGSVSSNATWDLSDDEMANQARKDSYGYRINESWGEQLGRARRQTKANKISRVMPVWRFQMSSLPSTEAEMILGE